MTAAVKSPAERLEDIRQAQGGSAPKKAASGQAKAVKATPAPAGKGKGPGNFGKMLGDLLGFAARYIYGARKPIHQEIIETQAAQLPDIVAELYAQDEWARKAIDWVNSRFGKADAWGKVATLAVTTYAALQLADGNEIPIIGVLAAPIVHNAAIGAAVRCATAEAKQAGMFDAQGAPVVLPERVEYWHSVLTSANAPEPAAAR